MEFVQKKSDHAALSPLPQTPSSGRSSDGASKEAAAEEEAKRMKRILQGREYSKKYRVRQMKYIEQVEADVKALQAEVAKVTSRVKNMNRKNAAVRAENVVMQQKLYDFAGEIIFKEAQYVELDREREILKQWFMMVIHQQNQQAVAGHFVVTAGAYGQIPAMNVGYLHLGFNFQ